MTSRRLALVIGSQCPAVGQLPFLPGDVGPVALAGLPPPQQLVMRLRDLLISGPGECTPVGVKGQSGPGLLLNPTKPMADAALPYAAPGSGISTPDGSDVAQLACDGSVSPVADQWPSWAFS